MEAQLRRMQRATVARSALDVVALIFLGCGFSFWATAFWQLLTPPAILSLLTIQAMVLALAFSLAAPLLLSMLVPTTPAGQLLQKTQWGTVGFYVILGAGIFMTYQAEQLIEVWLAAQPGLTGTNLERRLAIVLVIAFVVIPALAWVQLSPERFVQQIQQAHAVKKLEMQQRGELAIIKASILSAERKALIGWANLLPLEQQEVMHTIRGLIMASSDTQRDIVRTLGLGAELERDIMDDQQIAQQLDYVAQRLNVLPDIAAVVPAHTGETQALARVPDASGRAEAAPAPYTNSYNRGDEPDRRGSSQMIPHHEEYTIAFNNYGTDTAWSVKQLAGVLGIEPETAGKRRRAWEDSGLVSGHGLSNGRYRFVA